MRTLPLRSWTPLSTAADRALPEAQSVSGATELPAGVRQVLLKLRRGDLAARIFEHLREQGIPEPAKSDWSEAIRQGYVVRRDGTLQLTPAGLWAAGNIMRDLAHKFGIHTFTRRQSTKGPSTHCICGWTAHTSKARENTLSAYETVHLAAAADAKARGLPAPMDAFAIRMRAIFAAIEEGRTP